MRIAVGHHEDHATYIRHARTETLRSLCIEPHPALVEPVAASKYVFAYDDQSGQAIGMGESAMLGDIYDSYHDTPYATLGDLTAFCPLSEMASMRTVYVEPEYRNNSSLFLALTLCSAKVFHGYGARFATATTRADDAYLNRLYSKWCGERVGTFRMELTNEPSSLFVFDLERMLSHRAMRRVESYLCFEHNADAVVAAA